MEIQARLEAQQPGHIGLACSETARYSAFYAWYDNVLRPPGTTSARYIGLSVAYNYNQACREALRTRAEWLWLMDDDHVIPPETLLNLLEREVDIVSPLYLHRRAPFLPVLHGDETRKYVRYNFNYLKNRTGLLDVTEDATMPTGGMLIRRQVLLKIADPWFENGQIDSEWGSWDIYFCTKAKRAGFRLHLDTDNVLGHIVPVALFPVMDENGEWGMDIRQAI